MFGSSSSESQQSHSDLNMIEESVVSGNSHISTSKRKHSSYMRNIEKERRLMKEEIYHLKEANLMIQAQNATAVLT